MCTATPLLSEAMELLSEDLLIHLDQAAALATQADDWSEQDADAARGVISDLVLMIRGLLMEHGRQPTNDCRACDYDWPCPVAVTIHGFLKDPHRQFVALASRARDRG